MSDLISREEVIKCIEFRNERLMHDEEYRKKRGDIDLLGIIPSIHVIPSADIIEHAMAIKEYCEHFPECEGCRFYNGLPFRCTFGSCPQGWDLPEGERDLKNKG